MAPFQYLGIAIVSFFFLISGYGLMSSYIRNVNYLHDFFRKRILKVFIPYLVALICYHIFSVVLLGKSLADMFSFCDVGSWLPYSWFVVVLLLLYVLFYFTFKLKYSLRIKILAFACVSIVYVLLAALFEIPHFWYVSSPSVLLGILWKYNESSIKELLSRNYVFFSLAILSLLCIACSMIIGMKSLNWLFFCTLFILLVYVLPTTFRATFFVTFFSGISYEMYLMQGIAIQLVTQYLQLSNTFSVVLWVFGVDILISIVARRATLPILSRL